MVIPSSYDVCMMGWEGFGLMDSHLLEVTEYRQQVGSTVQNACYDPGAFMLSCMTLGHAQSCYDHHTQVPGVVET